MYLWIRLTRVQCLNNHKPHRIRHWLCDTWHLDITENVILAVGANFSAAIIAMCSNLNDYSCDLSYRFGVDPKARINVHKGSPTNFSGIMNIPDTDATVLYTYMKVEHMNPRVILNFTVITARAKEFNFTLRTNQLCTGALANVKFVGELPLFANFNRKDKPLDHAQMTFLGSETFSACGTRKKIKKRSVNTYRREVHLLYKYFYLLLRWTCSRGCIVEKHIPQLSFNSKQSLLFAACNGLLGSKYNIVPNQSWRCENSIGTSHLPPYCKCIYKI